MFYFSITRHFRKNLLIILGSIFPKPAFLIIFLLVAEARRKLGEIELADEQQQAKQDIHRANQQR